MPFGRRASLCTMLLLPLATDQLSKWMQVERQTNWAVQVSGLGIEIDKWAAGGSELGEVVYIRAKWTKGRMPHAHSEAFMATQKARCYQSSGHGPGPHFRIQRRN